MGSHSLLIRSAVWHSDAARGPSTPSLDHLVGELLEIERNLEAKRLGGLEVDHQLERGRLHHRQVAGLGAVENLSGVNADLTICSRDAGAVADQAAGQGEFAPERHEGERMARR